MEQDTEYLKLPLEERCVHKSWRARLHGYKECVTTFQCIDDEKSPEWNKFLGFIKKFVVDSNVAAQEKGLEAALAFIENAAVAGKTVGEVMNGIVTKCIAAPKAKTKELAVLITLMYIEIEKHEAVQDELLKGTEAKNPKIVASCISTLTLALRQFGPKVINIKPLVKKIPGFLEDRDKTVRDEGKFLVIEVYRWIGAPLKQQLNTLKPVQITELETEFSSLKEERVVPVRFLRSQKPKTICTTDSTSEIGDDGNEETDGGTVPDIDPYEMLDPVDILSKLPKDFYDKIEAKKWQERKEALELVETLVKNPKLENGDYGDLVRALKKVISKDTNVVVVALAGKCLAGLAGGLKKRFQPYATACLSSILEKFREKKQNVVQTLREAADAIFLSITIDVILEDTLAALENKNPAVKAETAAYLSRCFARTPPPSLNKKLLKAYTAALLKTLNEPDPTVRDNSAEALGTAMKLIGEKAMMPFLTDIDNLKMTKIKECADKAVILVKASAAPKAVERPSTAPSKVEAAAKRKETESKPTKRPNTGIAGGKKAPVKKPSAASLTNLAGSKKSSSTKSQAERNYSVEEIEEMAAQSFPAEVLSGLVDSNWKTRLAMAEQLLETIKQMDSAEVSAQVIVRTLARKPGFKDTNFQVLKLRLEIVKLLAENYPFSSTVCEYCIMDITEKLGDAKNSVLAGETLLAIAEATSFEYVVDEVIAFAFNQKNPKVQQETLTWLCKGLTEFGCTINVKSLIDNIKKAVAATNPGVRTAAITLLGTLYLYMGKPLLMFFENEKPALKQQIEQECDKHSGESPPVPTRGAKSKKAKPTDDDDEVEVEKNTNSNSELDINSLIPRIDIGNQITESLLGELSDKNWKVRNEGLQKVSTILSEAKFIKGSIGDLPQGLALRLVDSNSKIAQSTLGICQALAVAMGAPAKQHIRILFPGFVQCLGDSKNWIRAAAISCINEWGEQCGYKEFFDGEIIGDALKSGSPVLRAEVWNWLAQKLPLIPVKQVPKEELLVCLPYLYSNLEDRNSDVRKNAQEAVLGFMIHLSYEAMARNTEKLKPGSRTVVLAALDKSRPNLPVKPLPKKQAPEESTQKVVKSAGAAKAAKAIVKPKQNASSKPGSARKKDDDVDTSPLLAINNLKHQRVIDEQKLKVLKWNFTTPREEFVDLLKELMSTANVNKTLLANMFHSDFRYHLKAIEALTEDLPDNSKALVSNLDLILKWLTLRFFDTNPSVLLKGLDYLRMVFNLLIEDQYHMLENEAASFIPYLIIKIGDPKDAVRNGVRALFKQIALVYPVSKLFSYVMEGLKSKNARQRTECLDQLGSLIDSYGVSVCQPSASVALKEIAKQIADRDNSVRNAALNCIVQAYFLQGEKVYKLIGQISEKDQSLLDERIKRAAKNRPAKSASATRLSMPQNAVANPTEDIKTEYEEENEVEEIPEPSPPPTNELPGVIKKEAETSNEESQVTTMINESPSVTSTQSPDTALHNDHEDDTKTNSPTSAQPKVSGPFGLDMDLLQQIELNAPVKYRNPVLLDVSSTDLNEGPNTLNPPKVQVIPISPPKLLVSKSSSASPTAASGNEDSLERKILAMGSLDLPVAIQSMNSIENLLKSHQVLSLQSKEDKFIASINMQLRLLQTYSLQQGGADVSKGFRNTFMVLLTFYDSGILGKNVTITHLQELVDQMITLLAQNKLDRLHQAEAYYRVINSIVCRIIDNSNHTTIIRVLIKLLYGCAESDGPPKYEELVMKCLWKIVKTIPNWAADLDYDTILLEVHRFLKDYPTAWWKKRKSDTPLRTIKTILHSMTRVKGSTILSHLTLINNTNESELHSYLIRLIATFKPDQDGSAMSRASMKSGKTQDHLSKFTHQRLSEIFKMIGSKEHTHEGLKQLYDFKLQYPEADVQPFLVKSHQFFQDFIEQGLRDIDQARKNQNLISQTKNQYTSETAGTITQEKSLMDPIHRLERLRASEAQCRTTASQPHPT